ncbi:conserved hypothetical protein (plasmid) [Aromatoleum aromaticum EbN1]|uniref:3-phospho-D-glycerate guanylyltransferase n=1 Tax=Aromatoleum aromaticum (strain DSM 19018 / LMG 30748 / EbN1) TaxID=76114 RepID=Q5NW71_AROAE|nr:2-phospho-L-lactate guanylyltransferase [Aromatoleum aromaticum]CAI10693.1 conserved hypothetical protein [Aromatoleum aromaticum EbN1]
MWTILPAKNLCRAKQRLAGLLTPEERGGLFHAMLKDVLTVLCAHPAIEGVVVVSDDPAARRLAEQYRAEFLDESGLSATGLNAVVQAAAHRLAERGIDEVMVIHGDLPLINHAEITHLIDTHRSAPGPALTLAPDRQREGTNCLICTPASAIEFSYGASSLVKHARQAKKIGAAVHIVRLSGIGFDVDWPDDVLALIDQPELGAGRHTVLYLKDSDIAARAKTITCRSESIVA